MATVLISVLHSLLPLRLPQFIAPGAMPIRFVFCVVLSLTTTLPPAKASNGSVSILPSTSKLETLWEQGEFTEGVAVSPDGQIFFSDIPSSESTSGQILKFDPKTGKTNVFTSESE